VPQASFWQETWSPEQETGAGTGRVAAALGTVRGLREDRHGGNHGDKADHHGAEQRLEAALWIDGVHSGLLACAEDTLDVEQALDERVDVLAGRIDVERSSGGRSQVEALVERHRAVMAGADGDPGSV